MNAAMKSRLVFAAGGASSLISSAILFRDLADLSQWYLECDRNNVYSTFTNRHKWAFATVGGMGMTTYATFRMPPGNAIPKAAWAAVNGISLFCLYSGYMNPEIMMRPRNTDPLYVSSREIKQYMKPNETVIVTQMPGDKPRAFPDVQLLRPHVVRVGYTPENKNQVVMTYCG